MASDGVARRWRHQLGRFGEVELACGPQLIDRGSIFTATLCWPIKSVAAAEAAIAIMGSPTADHNMSAYRILVGRGIKKKYEDDGEARGGQRLLGSITKVKAIDCAVVVSRVFGGRMLGKVSVSFPPFSRISHTSFFPDLTGCMFSERQVSHYPFPPICHAPFFPHITGEKQREEPKQCYINNLICQDRFTHIATCATALLESVGHRAGVGIEHGWGTGTRLGTLDGWVSGGPARGGSGSGATVFFGSPPGGRKRKGDDSLTPDALTRRAIMAAAAEERANALGAPGGGGSGGGGGGGGGGGVCVKGEDAVSRVKSDEHADEQADEQADEHGDDHSEHHPSDDKDRCHHPCGDKDTKPHVGGAGGSNASGGSGGASSGWVAWQEMGDSSFLSVD